jgi:hypothetical protein
VKEQELRAGVMRISIGFGLNKIERLQRPPTYQLEAWGFAARSLPVEIDDSKGRAQFDPPVCAWPPKSNGTEVIACAPTALLLNRWYTPTPLLKTCRDDFQDLAK